MSEDHEDGRGKSPGARAALEAHRAATQTKDGLIALKHGFYALRRGGVLPCRLTTCPRPDGPEGCDVIPEGGCLENGSAPCGHIDRLRDFYVQDQVLDHQGDLTAADRADLMSESLFEALAMIGLEAYLRRYGPIRSGKRGVEWQPLVEIGVRAARMAADLRDRRLRRLAERRAAAKGGGAGDLARALAGMKDAKPTAEPTAEESADG